MKIVKSDITIFRTPVFKNKYFTVFKDDILLNSMLVAENYLSVCPNSVVNGSSGAKALIIQGESYLLAEGRNHLLDKPILGLLGGFLSKTDTDSASGLSREISEEIGISIKPENLISLGSFSPEPTLISGVTDLYLLTVDKGCDLRVKRKEYGLQKLFKVRMLELPKLRNNYYFSNDLFAALFFYQALGNPPLFSGAWK